MLSRKQKYFLIKFFSLFSVVSGYNILVIVIAQYLTSVYILAPDYAAMPIIQIIFWIPSGLFEIIIGIWLLSKGLNDHQGENHLKVAS